MGYLATLSKELAASKFSMPSGAKVPANNIYKLVKPILKEEDSKSPWGIKEKDFEDSGDDDDFFGDEDEDSFRGAVRARHEKESEKIMSKVRKELNSVVKAAGFKNSQFKLGKGSLSEWDDGAMAIEYNLGIVANADADMIATLGKVINNCSKHPMDVYFVPPRKLKTKGSTMNKFSVFVLTEIR